MLRILAPVILAVALFASPVFAQGDRAEVSRVIQSQIDAFLADDVETAFAFASPTIKELFGTPQNFGVMVERGYPMVWRPAEVEFLDTRREGSVVYQDVLITDESGVFHVLEYMMVRATGGWQINAVRIVAAPPVAA